MLSNGVFTVIRDGSAANTVLTGINNSGQIVGYSDFGGFIYSEGLFSHVLGTRTPLGINDAGVIVGIDFSDIHGLGFTFSAADGFGFLNHPDGSNGTFLEGINNTGQITGTYSAGRGARGFIASDLDQTRGVPEPATWVMIIFGFGAIGSGLRRSPLTLPRGER